MDDTERRCERDQRCAARTPIFDAHGDREGWQPALLDTPTGLCPADTRHLRTALAEFPHLIERMSAEHLPAMDIWCDLDVSGGGDAYAAIPLNTYIDAVGRLIDHELRVWTRIVVDHLHHPWSTAVEDRSAIGARIWRSATVLGRCLDTWIGLGWHEYRARSLDADPARGHGLVPVRWKNGDWWINRRGVDAAVVVLDLHARARRIVGEHAAQRSPLPCRNPACGAPTVFRAAGSSDWVCRTCRDTRGPGDHHTALAEWSAARAARLAVVDAAADTAGCAAAHAAGGDRAAS